MKFRLFLGAFFWLLVLLVSCSEEIKFDNPISKLRFSRDTVFCDTVFNQVRSETYAVKVYNSENKNVNIPRISLEGGSNSLYRINVDGRSGTDFSNIPLRAKDSLFIFVEIAPTSTAPVAIAEDRINFTTSGGQQHVTLFSVVEDAEFFISTKDKPKTITQNTTWKSDKSKVIFGDLTLAEGKTLTIEKGTKVYFHKNSGLTVAKGATLTTNGDLGSEVVFRGDRSDPKYDTLPANWNGIKVLDNSIVNFNYTKLQGGNTGLQLNNSTASIKNTIVHSFQDYGIQSIGSTVTAQNLIMANCGNACFGIFKGGVYDILQSTFANYWNLNGSLPGNALYVANEYNDGKTTSQGSVNLKLRNTIVYGSRQNAIVFKPTTGQTFTYNILNSLLKYDASSAGFTFDGNASILASLKNVDPLFLQKSIGKLNLRVNTTSPTKAKGDVSAAQQAPLDYAKVSRTASPTIGAYQ